MIDRSYPPTVQHTLADLIENIRDLSISDCKHSMYVIIFGVSRRHVLLSIFVRISHTMNDRTSTMMDSFAWVRSTFTLHHNLVWMLLSKSLTSQKICKYWRELKWKDSERLDKLTWYVSFIRPIYMRVDCPKTILIQIELMINLKSRLMSTSTPLKYEQHRVYPYFRAIL